MPKGINCNKYFFLLSAWVYLTVSTHNLEGKVLEMYLYPERV